MWVLVLAIVALSGCATKKPNEVIFDPHAPRMDQIYRGATGGGMAADQRPIIGSVPNAGREMVAGWVREQANEIHNLFPEGPNPVLYLFVFPHQTVDEVTISGFTTPFKMYERDYFALPGEVAP